MLSRRFLTLPTNSAEASDVPDFPLEPVNLVTQTPLFIYAQLFLSSTSGNVGSNAEFTSAERHSEAERTVRPSVPNSAARSAMKYFRYAEQSPVLPSLPVSSLSVSIVTTVCFGFSQSRVAERAV